MSGEKILDTPPKKPTKPPSCPFATMGTVVIQMMVRMFTDPKQILSMPTITMNCEYCSFYNPSRKKCIIELLKVEDDG